MCTVLDVITVDNVCTVLDVITVVDVCTVLDVITVVDVCTLLKYCTVPFFLREVGLGFKSSVRVKVLYLPTFVLYIDHRR